MAEKQTRKYTRTKPTKEKPIKEPKYNVKYINDEGTILFEDNFFKLKDCVDPLKKICPIMSKRRLDLIREVNTTDRLAPYIKIEQLR